MSLDTTDPAATLDEGPPVLEVTPDALAKVLDVRAGEENPDELCLRIGITGVNGVDYTYDLSFEPVADLEGEHRTYTQGDLLVAVPVDSIDRLFGSVLDIPSTDAQGGLVIRNPNRPNPLAGANLELTGDLAEQVQQLIAEAINPSLAAHGGFTSLVGVDEAAEGGPKVFLTMGGGCQGCSLSAATMVQGIQSAIKEAIPEVAEVVDVTDHAAGDNPFYT